MKQEKVVNGISFTADQIPKIDKSQCEEIKAHFEDAGITPGFFTVKMGNYEMTQYYSQSDVLGIVQSKERYDEQYEFMTQSGRYGKYVEPGSVIRIHGKEYAIDENNNVQIPYGEDIFSAEEVKK